MSEKPERPSDEVIIREWMTKAEVAKRINKSLAAVTRLSATGRLNPVSIKDGMGVAQNRYNPDEVQAILADPAMQPTSDDRREVFAEYQLDTVKAVIGLIREPRETIDKLQFEIIAELRKENGELRAEIKTMRADVEAARDNSAERQIGIEMVKNDQAIKKMATERVLVTLGKLISGPDGVQLTPDQWEELIIANGDGEKEFLTPDQVKKGKEIVARAKASTNGKGVVEAVKKTVIDTAGVQGT